VPNGWLRVVAALGVLGVGCQAAREYAENTYDDRRAQERKQAEDEEAAIARADAERPPTPRPTGPGLTPGTYRLKTLVAEAFPTTVRGKGWDDAPGAEPDLEMTVSVDGKRVVRCKAANDQLEGRCTFEDDDDDAEIEIGTASRIELAVIDRDSIVDDPIGTATLDGSEAWGTGIEMQLVPKGRLKSASIMIARVPTWWDLHGTTVLVFAGLVVVGTTGAIVLSNRRTQRKRAQAGKRCGACGARLANYAKCSDCGADQR
jgi:hypothetical protein